MKRLTSLLSIVLLALFLSSCLDNSMKFHQKVESPDGKYNYCLYLNTAGFGDPGFWVVKLDKSVNPKKIHVDSSRHVRDWKEVTRWVLKNQIIGNYDEGGEFTANPKLELLNKRFLVLSRGGYYFELYDLKLDKAVFNTDSPWNDWIPTSTTMKADKLDMDLARKDYGEWIKTNLNDPIAEYMRKNS